MSFFFTAWGSYVCMTANQHLAGIAVLTARQQAVKLRKTRRCGRLFSNAGVILPYRGGKIKSELQLPHDSCNSEFDVL